MIIIIIIIIIAIIILLLLLFLLLSLLLLLLLLLLLFYLLTNIKKFFCQTYKNGKPHIKWTKANGSKKLQQNMSKEKLISTLDASERNFKNISQNGLQSEKCKTVHKMN